MKKKKYQLLLSSLIGLAIVPIVPTIITLTSCSNLFPNRIDKIDYNKIAEGGIFYDENNHETIMDRIETPFKCDFNITKKTCSIFQYMGYQPNYFTKGLPNIQTNPNPSNYKNTLRIPSKILYKNEYYDVVSFFSFNENDRIHTLDIDCIADSTQVIEFDNNLNSQLATATSPYRIIITPSKYNNLLKILNFPGNLDFDTSTYPKLETFTFNCDYQNDRLNFYNCPSLKSIKIPSSVTNIKLAAFYGCNSLKTINIPNSVTSIGQYAFSRCSGLQSINLPNSLTSIGENAFSECHSLITIDIPNSVTSIGNYAFDGCDSLQTINIPNSITTIRHSAFNGCSSLQNINLPNSIISIEDSAFRMCSSLLSIDIPNSVINIGSSAFQNCTNLTNIIIPNSVTSIGNWAFDGCDSLQSIDIPNSVQEFGSNIFYSFRYTDGIKINFHSQQTMDLFLKTNPDDAKYCQLIINY